MGAVCLRNQLIIKKREVVLRMVTELTWMASQTLSVLRDNPSLPQTSWSASQTLLVNFYAASRKEGKTQTAVRVQEFQEKPRHKQERQMQGKHYYFSELQLLWLIQLYLTKTKGNNFSLLYTVNYIPQVLYYFCRFVNTLKTHVFFYLLHSCRLLQMYKKHSSFHKAGFSIY